MYAQPGSTLARELISLRAGRRARKGGRGPPPALRIREEPVHIDARPAEVTGRQVPVRWEGDVVIGKDGKIPHFGAVDRPGVADRRRGNHRSNRRAARADPRVVDLGWWPGQGIPQRQRSHGALAAWMAAPTVAWLSSMVRRALTAGYRAKAPPQLGLRRRSAEMTPAALARSR